ncbi:hypothetical protein BCR36DRAFT_291655, partial [Piromyces finnis]
KNNICASAKYDYEDFNLKIPNENGTLINYIVYTCTYEEIKSNKCCNDNSYYSCSSIICKSDSECISDKCFNNRCAINNSTSFVHCDSIYTGNKTSYMYCGKVFRDFCNNDDECSSKKCYDNHCLMQMEGPSSDESNENKNFDIYMNINIMIPYIAAILLLILCCYKHKKKNNKNNT